MKQKEGNLIRSMKKWSAEWDARLVELMPNYTNCRIAKMLGATSGLVGHRIKRLGLTRTPEQHQRLYAAYAGRLNAGVNPANQQPSGTCRWINKRPTSRRTAKPEWWIFLGRGERMPLRRYLWETWVGPVPKGYNVCFADADPRRCLLSNLICMPTAQMPGYFREQIRQAMYRRAYWLTPEWAESRRKTTASMRKFWQSPEGKAVLAAKSQKMRDMYAADAINNPWRRLHDSAVAYYLARDPEIREEILTHHPELIELKRTQLQLNRAINHDNAKPAKTRRSRKPDAESNVPV